MKRFRLYLLLVTGFSLLLFPACPGGNDVKPGEIAYIVDTYVGQVSVSHNSGNTWKAIEVGSILRENDMIKTGNDSFVDIIMPERGIFRVSFDTIVQLKTLTQRMEKISVKKGKLFVNVTQKLSEEEKFQVETDVAVVAVRGTQFAVETDGETTKTTVNQGKVIAIENIDIEGDVETQDAIDKALEVEVSSDEVLEIDKTTQEKMKKEIVETVKKGDKEKAVEKAKQLREENKPKKKNVMKKDKDTWKSLSKEEKKKQIKMKLEELHKQKQMERKKDENMLKKVMDKNAGTNSMAKKHVGKTTTTLQDDIKDDVANKKVKDTKEKLGINNNVDEMMDDSVSDEDSMNSLMNRNKPGKEKKLSPAEAYRLKQKKKQQGK